MNRSDVWRGPAAAAQWRQAWSARITAGTHSRNAYSRMCSRDGGRPSAAERHRRSWRYCSCATWSGRECSAAAEREREATLRFASALLHSLGCCCAGGRGRCPRPAQRPLVHSVLSSAAPMHHVRADARTPIRQPQLRSVASLNLARLLRLTRRQTHTRQASGGGQPQPQPKSRTLYATALGRIPATQSFLSAPGVGGLRAAAVTR